jgi:monoamine oxidase
LKEVSGIFLCSPLSSLSLNLLAENLLCAGTYKKVLDTIAKPALESAEIKYETKVERISYRHDPEEKVKIQVNGGQTLEFDEVVVTTPLGWLKRNLDAFEPALPARMTKAIEAIGYGCLEKVCATMLRLFPSSLSAWC